MRRGNKLRIKIWILGYKGLRLELKELAYDNCSANILFQTLSGLIQVCTILRCSKGVKMKSSTTHVAL